MPKQVSGAVSVVKISRFSNEINNTDAKNINAYTTKYEYAKSSTCLSTDFPSTFIVVTLLGLTIFFILHFADFISIIIRDIFIPPPVDPAHAPTTINSNNNICDSVGHIPKSVVANPVVVIIEATWNIEYLNDSLIFPYIPNVLTVIIPVNTAIINIYHLSSSLLKICLKSFSNNK